MSVVLPTPISVLITQCRTTLTQERTRIVQAFLQDDSIKAVLTHYQLCIDGILKQLWQAMNFSESFALLAVGGYGRHQLFPYADVDLLILLPDAIDDAARPQLEQFTRSLWDIGLEIGYSTRNIAECLEVAQQDISVQTALLEARFLLGNATLTAEFTRVFQQQLEPHAFFQAKQVEQQQRHARFQNSAFNLEPNIKDSPGGLRDLHVILWCYRAIGLGEHWDDLVKHDVLTKKEVRQIKRYEAFLQQLRVRVHYLAKRREDRLLFDFQDALANQMGIQASVGRRASEKLMQHYYRTAKAVTQFNTVLLQSLRTRLAAQNDLPVVVLNTHFQARGELLEIIDEADFINQSAVLFESFLLLQDHPQLRGMSAATLKALWRSRSSINAAFRKNPEISAKFIQMLRNIKTIPNTLDLMHRYGILGRYIPSFGRIEGQMQHDLFHVYTVDEHILKVIRNVARFMIPEFMHEYPLCSRLMTEFERPEVLLIAALFHDIAKGRGGDHSTLGTVDAQSFCQRHLLQPEDTALVMWLVEHHLAMSSTAQKKDLSDPAVIASFATFVGNERSLIALLLLTVADIRGTSPKVWNAWKAKLLQDLFTLTQRYLDGNVYSSTARLERRQVKALETLKLYGMSETAHLALWEKLGPLYFLRHDANEIAWHTRVLGFRIASETPVVKARLSPIGEGLQILIYIKDRKNLFASICDFFGRLNYNIVEAKIYTTEHGYALDSFQVLNPFQATELHYQKVITQIEFELTDCLERDLPLTPAAAGRISRQLRHFPITPDVSIKADESGERYILSIVAGDRPGLLARIAYILADYRISVETARINTLGERAEDIFLIRGENLEQAQTLIKLEAELFEQLA